MFFAKKLPGKFLTGILSDIIMDNNKTPKTVPEAVANGWKVSSIEPHPYLWNSVEQFPPPNCKLQLYTISGISVNGKYNEFVKGFITDWAYLLPSPSKQRGNLK